jgi:hypothetical protein
MPEKNELSQPQFGAYRIIILTRSAFIKRKDALVPSEAEALSRSFWRAN